MMRLRARRKGAPRRAASANAPCSTLVRPNPRTRTRLHLTPFFDRIAQLLDPLASPLRACALPVLPSSAHPHLAPKLASRFLNLPVSVTLTSGRGVIEGVIEALDPVNGTIHLQDAIIRLTGAPPRAGGVQLINRSDVAGLALLSINKAQSPVQPQQPSYAAPSVTLQAAGSADGAYDGLPTYDHPAPATKAKRTKGKKGKVAVTLQSQPRMAGFYDGSEADDSDRGAVRFRQPAANAGSFDEDFDFSAGLQSFDKKKVFAHIQVSLRDVT